MKTVRVYVYLLKSHEEKYKVQKSFEDLGWTVDFYANPAKDLVPKLIVDFYDCTWWDETNPRYPIIPKDCTFVEL